MNKKLADYKSSKSRATRGGKRHLREIRQLINKTSSQTEIIHLGTNTSRM